jgi:hypothetical protein
MRKDKMWSKMAFCIYMLIIWELNLSKTFLKRKKNLRWMVEIFGRLRSGSDLWNLGIDEYNVWKLGSDLNGWSWLLTFSLLVILYRFELGSDLHCKIQVILLQNVWFFLHSSNFLFPAFLKDCSFCLLMSAKWK